jgi:hypothetical protein
VAQAGRGATTLGFQAGGKPFTQLPGMFDMLSQFAAPRFAAQERHAAHDEFSADELSVGRDGEKAAAAHRVEECTLGGDAGQGLGVVEFCADRF